MDESYPKTPCLSMFPLNPKYQVFAFLFLSVLTSFFIFTEQAVTASDVSGDSDLIARLKNALKNKSKDIRLGAAKQLSDLGNKAAPAIPDLIDALTDADDDIRSEAKWALAHIGEPTVPFLIKALQGKNLTIRLGVPTVFFMLGPKAHSATPLLIAMLKDPNRALRYEAAYALFRVQDDKAIAALIEVARSDSDDLVRMEALGALSNYKGAKIKGAIPLLIQIFEKDRNSFVGSAAGDVLVEIGSDAVPALARMLTNPHNRRGARATAGELLGRLGPTAKNALPSLMEAVADPDKSVRFYAIEALGQLGPNGKAAAPILMKLTKDKLVELRLQAAVSLYQVCPGNEVTLPTLIEALKGSDSEGRWSAAHALAKVGPQAKNAIPELVVALKDRDPNVRIAADLALTEIGSRRDK